MSQVRKNDIWTNKELLQVSIRFLWNSLDSYHYLETYEFSFSLIQLITCIARDAMLNVFKILYKTLVTCQIYCNFSHWNMISPKKTAKNCARIHYSAACKQSSRTKFAVRLILLKISNRILGFYKNLVTF